MEASLDDSKSQGDYDLENGDLKITYPLNRCVKGLKEKYNAIARIHRERLEQVQSMESNREQCCSLTDIL